MFMQIKQHNRRLIKNLINAISNYRNLKRNYTNRFDK